jgi:hypothetical protein
MKTETSIDTYENSEGQKPATVLVKSHWNWDDFALVIVNGQLATVNRHEMIAALQKAGCKR